MVDNVVLSWDKLVSQASGTAAEYAMEADRLLRRMYPDLSDKERATLLPAYMKVAAMDFATTAFVVALQKLTAAQHDIAEAIREPSTHDHC